MSLKDKYYKWADSLNRNFAIKMATVFGLGNLIAPGTWGAAAGIILYPIIFDSLNIPAYLFLAFTLAYFAVGICDAAERFLGERDPGVINLDEFVAMPFCYFNIFGEKYTLWGLIAGFLLFRFFDIKKPLIIYKMQSLEGGLGCVADDVVAGFASCICLTILSMFINFLTY